MNKFLVVKHKYTSALSCCNKVKEYIEQRIHCAVLKIDDKWSICFGQFDDKADAQKLRKDLMLKGISTSIKRKE